MPVIVISDQAVLGIKADYDTYVNWTYTPGASFWHGEDYVRLAVLNLKEPITVSDYKIFMYGNYSRADIFNYPFHYEMVWCTDTECNNNYTGYNFPQNSQVNQTNNNDISWC
jgi:hypothetical protein